MNNNETLVLKNLCEYFYDSKKIDEDFFESSNWNSVCPIGIEIEVKWKYYFPELWDKYLKHTQYKDLTISRQEELTKECTEQEKTLLPKLKATEECGIERGADRYWEFAFGAVTDVGITIKQLSVLQDQNLIPTGNHSLHMTIGNLKGNKDSYYMLLLLEILFGNKERIESAFHKENDKLSNTWARKGMGGLFEKQSHELKYGYQNAIELRTLEVTPDTNIAQLLCLSSYVADIIYDKMQKKENKNIKHWEKWLYETQNILIKKNLIDVNWKKPNLTPEYWLNYIAVFDEIKLEIGNLYIDILQPLVNDKIQKTISQVNNNKSKNKINAIKKFVL